MSLNTAGKGQNLWRQLAHLDAQYAEGGDANYEDYRGVLPEVNLMKNYQDSSLFGVQVGRT